MENKDHQEYVHAVANLPEDQRANAAHYLPPYARPLVGCNEPMSATQWAQIYKGSRNKDGRERDTDGLSR